jgi:hypothetical protein
MVILVTVLGVHGASESEVQLELERARADLRISQATEERILFELERLKNSGEATPEILEDYEIYLNLVQAMVTENQKIVDSMEAAYLRHFTSDKTTGCSKSMQSDGNLHTEFSTEDAPDQLTALDRELDDSLAAFDEMLLKEMEEIRAESENKMTSMAEEAAAAAKRLRDKGVDVSSPSEGDDAQEPSKDEPDQGGSYEETASADDQDEQSSSGGDATYGKRAERPHESDQDDDIVARQLREAAEKETDPELKEKLWKEYEDYKRGSN